MDDIRAEAIRLIQALPEGSTWSDILRCLRENQPHIPNEKTLRAMRDVEAGIGMTTCDSFEDFCQKLNI